MNERTTSCWAVALLLALATAAWGQNLPPVAVAEAPAGDLRPGQALRFTGSNSYDPDSGPSPLEFEWDFGDGDTSTEADPLHAFAERGLYTVSLRVFDGRNPSFDTLLVGVLEAPTAAMPSSSSTLAASSDGGLLWVAGTDAGTVTLVDVAARAVVEEIPACAAPVSLDTSADDSLLVVSCRDDAELLLIDTATRTASGRLPAGGEPRGLVFRPGSTEALVARRAGGGQGELLIVDPADASAARVVALGGRPRAIAVSGDGSRAVVSDFLAGELGGRAWVVDLDNASVIAEVSLGPDPSIDSSSSGRGLPNLLGSVAIEPSGRLALVGGLKSNVFRGLLRDGQPLRPTNRVRGLVAPFELATGIEREDWRFDLNDADAGSALAFSSDGRHLFVAHQGTGELSVYDVLAPTLVDPFDGSAVPRLARVTVGEAPAALALVGDTLFVHVPLDRGVVAVDVGDPAAPAVGEFIATESESLPPAVLQGKRLFHRSNRPVHSSEGYVACASCHPEGGHDAMTWDFSDGGEGLRNTTDLRGRGGTAHGPVHWSANFDEIQDFENDIVAAFGGTGLAGDGLPPNPPLGAPNGGRSQELDDLAAYVASLDRAPASPWRQGDGGLSPAAERGRLVFHRAESGCADCHLLPRFTDSTLADGLDGFRLHDVGTIRPESGSRLGGPLDGLDTPTLKGLWDGAPYLHDGRAVTVRELLVDLNPDDRHGRTSDLTVGEIDDLIAFLLSIDEGADLGPDPPVAAPAEAGSVVASSPLLVSKSGASLRLRWGAAAEARSYRVTRGELIDFSRHLADDEAGSCDTAGELQLFDSDDLGNGRSQFYLVAAHNELGEGGFGPGRPARTPTPSCP